MPQIGVSAYNGLSRQTHVRVPIVEWRKLCLALELPEETPVEDVVDHVETMAEDLAIYVEER